MTPETNKALIRRMMEWWTEGRADVLDETLSRDFVAHTPNGDVRGREAQKERLATICGMFTDRRLAIEQLLAEDDLVAMRYIWEATHTREAFGIRPTGGRVKSTTFALYRIARGRIAEAWEVYDTQSLMQQLRA